MGDLISILIPAYNEEETIEKVINEISDHCKQLNYELIVIDDGSEDRTVEVVKQLDKPILIEHEQNKGKGRAIQTGLDHCNGEIIIIQDADMEYHPKDIPKLVQPILNNEADVVFGSRFRGDGINTMSFSHKVGNWGLTRATRLLYGFNTTDMETGYKIFRRELLDGVELRANSFNIEPEMTAIFSKRGARFVELPISYNYREKGEAKISWIDGIIALWWLIKMKFRKI